MSAGPGFVVMAVFRPDPALLTRQIDSLQAQSVADWRCLIGIDGVDPEVRALVLDLVDADVRFEVREYEDNVGVYRHFERLLDSVPVGAAWVSLADQDDVWYTDKFERLLTVLDGPGVAAVSGQARLVDTSGAVLGTTDRLSADLGQLLLRNQVSGALVLFRRSVLDLALPFPGATDIAIHDHWLGVCAAAMGRVVVEDVRVQDYVQHAANVLGSVTARPPSLPFELPCVIGAGGCDIWTTSPSTSGAGASAWPGHSALVATPARCPRSAQWRPEDRLSTWPVPSSVLSGREGCEPAAGHGSSSARAGGGGVGGERPARPAERCLRTGGGSLGVDGELPEPRAELAKPVVGASPASRLIRGGQVPLEGAHHQRPKATATVFARR